MMSLILSMISKLPRNTQGNANIKVCPNCFLKMCQSALKPLSKIRIGRKIIRMPWGLISLMVYTACPK
jgi:hypothetical protein